MADVHLGARHDDLGTAAAAQRERQFAAFHRAIELAVSERADLVLICGDLFDSNAQPRRSVERAAAELADSRRAPYPGGHHPGHARLLRPELHLPGLRPAGRWPAQIRLRTRVTVLTDSQPSVDFPAARPDRPRLRVPDQARTGQPTGRFQRAQRREAAQLAGGHDPRLHAHPRQVRAGRRDLHRGGGGGQRPGLPGARPLALLPPGQGRARRRGLTPARRSRLRSTRTAPGRC